MYKHLDNLPNVFVLKLIVRNYFVNQSTYIKLLEYCQYDQLDELFKSTTTSNETNKEVKEQNNNEL